MNPLNVFLILAYDLLIVAGSTWLIVEKDWSMWTYLLTMCFMLTLKEKDGT
jgi:hypothetical protein